MDLENVKTLLIRERERLPWLQERVQSSGELDQTQQEAAGDLASQDQHVGDAATQTFQREQAESINERLEGEEREVDAALERIENDEYGTCEQCGRTISDERLEALPSTRYCREHALSGEEVEPSVSGWRSPTTSGKPPVSHRISRPPRRNQVAGIFEFAR